VDNIEKALILDLSTQEWWKKVSSMPLGVGLLSTGSLVQFPPAKALSKSYGRKKGGNWQYLRPKPFKGTYLRPGSKFY
jgi:hypothetical protein